MHILMSTNNDYQLEQIACNLFDETMYLQKNELEVVNHKNLLTYMSSLFPVIASVKQLDQNYYFYNNKHQIIYVGKILNRHQLVRTYPQINGLVNREHVFLEQNKQGEFNTVAIYPYIQGQIYKKEENQDINNLLCNNLISLKNIPVNKDFASTTWVQGLITSFNNDFKENKELLQSYNTNITNKFTFYLNAFNKLNEPNLSQIKLVFTHYDLHNKNIIITQNNTPVFIDAATLNLGFLGTDLNMLLNTTKDEQVLIRFLDHCTSSEIKAIYLYFYNKFMFDLIYETGVSKNTRIVLNGKKLQNDLLWCQIIEARINKKKIAKKI